MNAKILCFKICAIVLLSLTVSFCAAQDQPDTLSYYIQTTDGNTYRGQILSQDSLEVLFNLEGFGEKFSEIGD